MREKNDRQERHWGKGNGSRGARSRGSKRVTAKGSCIHDFKGNHSSFLYVYTTQGIHTDAHGWWRPSRRVHRSLLETPMKRSVSARFSFFTVFCCLASGVFFDVLCCLKWCFFLFCLWCWWLYIVFVLFVCLCVCLLAFILLSLFFFCFFVYWRWRYFF